MRGFALLALLPLMPLMGCFPDLPDESVIANLRIVAIRSEPAVLPLDVFPPPPMTLEALVVDPRAPENGGITHTWAMELGDEEFDGRAELEALIPPGPHGPTLEIDFAPLLGARDQGWLPASFAIKYTVDNGDVERQALKFVHLLFPEPPVEGEVPVPAAEHPGFNTNPTITYIERIGGDSWEPPPGPGGRLDLGSADPDVGVEMIIGFFDEEDGEELDVELYWTNGDPGLPLPPEEDDVRAQLNPNLDVPRTDEELVDDDGNYRWTPPVSSDVLSRVFVVVRDNRGAQTWQELRFDP